MAICHPPEARTLLAIWSYLNDPDTSLWGADERGFMWWNRTACVFKYWDGSSIQTVGGILAGTAIASNPGSGEYRIKYMRRNAAGQITVVYDGTPEP
jgi:ligand-binding sensor domain-containing protein